MKFPILTLLFEVLHTPTPCYLPTFQYFPAYPRNTGQMISLVWVSSTKSQSFSIMVFTHFTLKGGICLQILSYLIYPGYTLTPGCHVLWRAVIPSIFLFFKSLLIFLFNKKQIQDFVRNYCYFFFNQSSTTVMK